MHITHLFNTVVSLKVSEILLSHRIENSTLSLVIMNDPPARPVNAIHIEEIHINTYICVHFIYVNIYKYT